MNTNAATAAVQANGNYRMAVLDAHRQSVATLKAAKEAEAQLRAEVISLFSERVNDANASGVENIDTGMGKLKITHKLNYTLGNADLVDKALDLIEKSQEGGNVIAERLVSWKPELSIREYKLLSAQQKAYIDTVLTVKPGTPSVELEA